MVVNRAAAFKGLFIAYSIRKDCNLLIRLIDTNGISMQYLIFVSHRLGEGIEGKLSLFVYIIIQLRFVPI